MRLRTFEVKGRISVELMESLRVAAAKMGIRLQFVF